MSTYRGVNVRFTLNVKALVGAFNHDCDIFVYLRIALVNLRIAFVSSSTPHLRGVPAVVALLPGQLGGEAGGEVEERPGHDHVVVGRQQERDHHRGQARACTYISTF